MASQNHRRHVLILVATAFILCLFIQCGKSQLVFSFCTTSFTRERVPGVCRPLVKCVRNFHQIHRLRNHPCTLKSGHYGVCCPYFSVPAKPKNKKKSGLLRAPPPPRVEIPPIRTNDINTAARAARRKKRDRINLQRSLRINGVVAKKRGSPASVHRHLQRSNKMSRKLGNHAMKIVDTSSNLVESFGLSKDQGKFALPTFATKGTNLAVPEANEESDCSTIEDGPKHCGTESNSPFRTQDGSCNNLKHPLWGRANSALTRLLPPDYEDGVSLPRGSSHNVTTLSKLPSARMLSTALISHEDKPDTDYTLLLMQWGQFLDHDITHTPINKASTDEEDESNNLVELDEDDENIKCCQNGFQLTSRQLHPECFPIDIPTNDFFFARLRQRCMEFVRSMPAERPDCSLGPREQVNQITSYIDASNVYGSDIPTSRRLRLGRRGRLRVTRLEREDLLPLAPEECADHSKRHYCFAAGDQRCNEQPQLTVMHTMWLREHNRIVSQLSLLNSHWGDERLYQESRRIVSSQMQHITYNEWLPIILGLRYMDDFNMKPQDSGHSQQYDPDVNPAITNSFATAAFRFGHSLVQSKMEWFGPFGNLVKSLPLHQHQSSPFEIYEENSIDGFLRGLTTQNVQAMDSHFSEELTQRLFQGTNSSHGMDLVALNVQRGRDHGLPPYSEWRKICGLSTINSWKQMASIVTEPQLVPRLQRLYHRIEEVDVFIGAIIEKPQTGSLLGPTFQCIVGDQFRRLRLGDRFWYEEPKQAGSFTQAQLNAIKETSMARILCDNGDNIQLMQPLAFKSTNDMNRKIGCGGKGIPRVDLSAWRE
jgi:peroxidase